MTRLGLLLLFAAACVSSKITLCDDGTACPPDTQCALITYADHSERLCVGQDRLDACAGGADGTPCESPENGSCHDGVCLSTACPNGLVDHDETCDDGNSVNGDGCSSDCQSNETCGNAIIDLAQREECDPGLDYLSHDGCSSACKLERATWTSIAIDRPSPRDSSAMVFDSLRHRVMLFGGEVGGEPDDHTYEWDGQRWHATYPIQVPQQRFWHAMAYDEAHHETVLFGGITFGADTWTWDGGNWRLRTPTTQPEVRVSSQMAYDAVRKRVVLFGGLTTPGQNAGVYKNDTWTWDGSDWTLESPAASPPVRAYHSMAFDPGRGVVVMFGGASIDSNTGVVSVYNDVWEWDGTTWSQKSAAGTPPSMRVGSAMAYDPVNEKMMIAGGGPDFGTGLNDAFEWDGATWTAVPGQPCIDAPSCLRHVMASDPVHGGVVVFGTSGDFSFFDGTQWSSPPGNSNLASIFNPPSGREAVGIATDTGYGEIVIFGGTPNRSNAANAETYTWNGGWRPMSQILSVPAARFGVGMTYDPKRSEVLLYGGCKPAIQTGPAFGDTWHYKDHLWLPLTPANPPPPLCWASMAYDEARDRVVLFGGNTKNGNGGFLLADMSSDTYTWNGTDWHLETPANKPSARFTVAMAYDPASQRVVMFGGTSDDRTTYLWDGTNWTEAVQAYGPSPREEAAMAYDAARHHVVLVGGRNPTNGLALDDTWEWDGAASTWIEIATVNAIPRESFGLTPALDGQGLLLFGGLTRSGITSTLYNDLERRRWDSASPDETCTASDSDLDGQIGCGDPDCWWACSANCPIDTPCSLPATCGDQTCNPLTEQCDTCAADCGACIARCGDFTCAATESVATCAGDCTP